MIVIEGDLSLRGAVIAIAGFRLVASASRLKAASRNDGSEAIYWMKVASLRSQ
jgi:hypothetical protein